MFIARFDEIGIKGNNRILFERRLEDNIKALCARHGKRACVSRPYGRLLIDVELDAARFRQVFGLSSVSRAVSAATMDGAKEVLRSVLPKSSQTFRISCQRLDKSFPLDSKRIAAELGAFVCQESGAKAKMVSPDVDIEVEVIDGALYVCTETVRCFGGLPVGIEGSVF